MSAAPFVADDQEHHVVSTTAYVALVDIVKALNGVAQLASDGRLDEGEAEVGNDLLPVFRPLIT